MHNIRFFFFLVVAYCVSILSADAATLTVYLYDENNRSLGHGDAMIIVESPDPEGGPPKWTRYLGRSLNQPRFRENLPDESVVNITIYTNQNTLRRDIVGLYGRANHTLHLKADPEYMQRCGSYETDYGVPGDIADLMDQLDRAYPNGTPRQMTNIREFLSKTVLPILDELAVPDDPNAAEQQRAFRSRVLRHMD